MAVGPLGSTRLSMRRCGRNSRVPYEFAHGTDQPGHLLHQMSVRVFVIVGFKGIHANVEHKRHRARHDVRVVVRLGGTKIKVRRKDAASTVRPYWAPATATPRGRPRRTQIRHKYAATPAEASKAIKPSRRVALMPRIIATRTAPTMLSTRATCRPSR
jgi:hypothetical protein